LHIPIFVRGTDAVGDAFLDLSRTTDISSQGACLALSRRLRSNELLVLTIPAPPPSPTGLLPAETPPIQARVKRQLASGDLQLIGVEFLHPLD
jgi:hypothetical protein